MRKYLNDHMKEARLHELVRFLPSLLPIVRNGFNCFGGEDLLLDLFQWFRKHTCQKEDFADALEKLNLEADVFFKGDYQSINTALQQRDWTK